MNARDPSRRSRGQRGAVLVEFALASVVFLGMILGIYEMFLGLYTYHCISESAREGTRYAIVRGSSSCINTPGLANCNATAAEVQSYVQGLAFPGIDTVNSMTVTVSWLTVSTAQPATWSACTPGGSVTCNLPGNLVKVQVQYAFPLSLPFFSSNPLNLSSTSQMAIAQ
jgi:Flp pilus assembly protein TadG